MKLGQETRSVFGGTDAWKTSEGVLSIVNLVCACLGLSVAVFIRKDFGERYLSWVNLFFGYTVVANFSFFGGLITMFTHRGGEQFMFFFWIAFILVSLWHKREIARKIKAGERWHSMYAGTSILPLPLSQENIYKFGEPAVVLGIGYLLWEVSGQVGLWLILSGLALFVNNHIIYHNQRQAILDVRDAEIEAKNIGGAFAGKPPRETGGVVVAESNVALFKKDADLQEAFSNLSPELKDLLGNINKETPVKETPGAQPKPAERVR